MANQYGRMAWTIYRVSDSRNRRIEIETGTDKFRLSVPYFDK